MAREVRTNTGSDGDEATQIVPDQIPHRVGGEENEEEGYKERIPRPATS